jgi:hypothetical protein
MVLVLLAFYVYADFQWVSENCLEMLRYFWRKTWLEPPGNALHYYTKDGIGSQNCFISESEIQLVLGTISQ